MEKIPPCHPSGDSGAICEPIDISTNAPGAYAIGLAVVGDYVHWGNGQGSVVRVRYDGMYVGSFGNGQDTPALATDGKTVFYADWYDPFIRGLDVPALSLRDISQVPYPADAGMSASAQNGHLVERGGKVFWAAQYPNGIWMAKTDGTQAIATLVAQKTDDTTALVKSCGVAVDTLNAFWTDANHVYKILISKAGDAGSVLDLGGFANAGDIAVDDNLVYVASDTGISQMKKDGSGRTDIPTGRAIRNLLLDGNYLYWTQVNDKYPAVGGILRVPRGGTAGQVEVVAQNIEEPFALAADCGALYVSQFNFGVAPAQVFKVRKP
jgi:hypothetical protein